MNGWLKNHKSQNPTKASSGKCPYRQSIQLVRQRKYVWEGGINLGLGLGHNSVIFSNCPVRLPCFDHRRRHRHKH